MSLDIGKLVATLALNDVELRKNVDKDLQKLEALEVQLEALDKKDTKVKLQSDEAVAKIEALRERLRQLKEDSAQDMDVRVETAQAQIELEALLVRVRELSGKEIKLKATADTAEAEVAVSKLDREVTGLMKSTRDFNQQHSLLTSALAFGPAALPLLGGGLTLATGGLFALAGGMAVAAASAGTFKLAMSGMGTAIQAYQTYQTSMANLTGTPKQQAAQKKAAQLALDKSAYGTTTPQAQAFVRTYESTFVPRVTALRSSAQAGLLPGLTASMRDLSPALPAVGTAAKDVGQALGAMADETARALSSPFWRQFILFIGRDAKTDLPLVGKAVGNLFHGLAQGVERFNPDGTHLLVLLDEMTAKFAHWTAGNGFEQFVKTVGQDGHDVIVFFQDAWPVAKAFMGGMTGAGAAELQVIGLVLKGIASLPTGSIETMGRLLPPLLIAMKIAPAAAGGMTGLAKALGKSGDEAQAFGAKAGFAAGGILLLADGLMHAHGAAGMFEDAVGGAAIGSIFGPWGIAIGGIVGGIAGLTKDLWSAGDAAQTNYVKLGETQTLREAKSQIDALAASLNQVTGAYTGATRAAVFNSLQTNPHGRALLQAAAARGVSGAQVVSAVMGNGTAARNVVAATQGQISVLQRQNAALEITKNNPYASYDQIDAATAALKRNQDQIGTLTTALGYYKSALVDAATKDRAASDAINSVTTNLGISAQAFRSWPKSLQTELSLKNRPETLAGIQEIVNAAVSMPGFHPASKGEAQSIINVLIKADPQLKVTSSQVRTLVELLDGVRQPPPVNVKVLTGAASRALANLALQISGLGAIAPVINSVLSPTKSKPKVGTAHAGGGWIMGPGTATSDSVLTPTSDGEFVIRAAMAAKNAGLVTAINNGASPAVLAQMADANARAVIRQPVSSSGLNSPIPRSGSSSSGNRHVSLRITNWDEGTGHFESIVDGHIAYYGGDS